MTQFLSQLVINYYICKMIIELTEKEFSRKNSIREFDNPYDNTYSVLSYIAHIKLHRDDPRMVKILDHSGDFEIVVDKPLKKWRPLNGDHEYHTQKVKVGKCCKCAWSPGAEIINMQINYNEVLVMGLESKRDFLIDELIKNK